MIHGDPNQLRHEAENSPRNTAEAVLRNRNRALEAQVRRMRHLIYDNTLQLMVAMELALNELSSSATPGTDVSRIMALLNKVEDELRMVAAEVEPEEEPESAVVWTRVSVA